MVVGCSKLVWFFFFFNDTATTEIYTLSLHDALPISMSVEPVAEAEFNEWYNKEHVPALAAVPGVLCARRFRATSANRRYVALYHLASPDVQATPAWKSAADTEWTRKLRPHFRDHLRLVCKRYARGG